MSDKLERIKNLILSVAINNGIIKFGSKEHLNIINEFEKVEKIEDVKKIERINLIIEEIESNEKLMKILENDIEIDFDLIKGG